MRGRATLILVLATALVATPLAPAYGAVTVSRAEISGSRLRLEGTATANRDITVDGEVLGRSSSSGRFRISRTPYTAPPDCTVDVNDGSAAPRVVTLSGCTVSQPAPDPEPSTSPPTLVSPAAGASVTTPFTIAWTSDISPDSINGGFNWEVSTTSTFSTVVLRDSTLPSVRQDTVSGIPAGTYFWRVQAVDGELNLSPFSAPRSVTVTGASAGQLGAATLSLPPYGSSFHPFESFEVFWTAVTGAATYTLQFTKDSSFPAGTFGIDNITDTSTGITIGDFCGGCEQGTYFARVIAEDADGVQGAPSNTISFTISYDAPLPPPPAPLSPADGAQLTLPISIDWADVPNPQPSGYELQIARDSAFTDIEDHAPQLTSSQRTVLSLTSGTKFWRVRSHQGDASATTAAVTDWSPTRTFTVAPSASGVQSVWLGAPPCENPCPGADNLDSGQEITGSIQLTTAAPAGGAVVTLTSDPASGASHPATVTIPAGLAFATFRLFAGEVTTVTPVTLTATMGSSSASFAFTVHPTTVERLSFCCDTTGGFEAPGFLQMTGKVPAGGLTVSLSSSSPLAQPPATVTVPAGSFALPVPIPTSAVTEVTTVTITATLGGTTITAPLRLYPQVPPSSLVLDRTETTGAQGAAGVVRIATGQTHEVQMRITSSHPAIADPQDARIGYQGTGASFTITTQPPAESTVVTISATGAGVTLTATLTVHPSGGPTPPPPAPATLSAVTLSPATVTSGATSTGTVTLTAAAPAGGATVALTSSASAATVPASVTVPAGATSATFAVTAGSVTTQSTTTIGATYAGASRSAVLTVTPPAAPSTDTVAVQRAEYDDGRLRVEATSTSSTATLRVTTSTGALIGTLSNDGGGRYRGELSWPTNPQSITVTSSLGGSATRSVS